MENNQLIFYSTPQGNVKVEVFFEDETFWLSQKRMAELFGVDVRTVNEHLKNIFKTGELKEGSVIRKFRITAADGKNYHTKFYMLDAILAVGYRVNSSEIDGLENVKISRSKEQEGWAQTNLRGVIHTQCKPNIGGGLYRQSSCKRRSATFSRH